jgi:hypothetical protein
VNVKILKRLGLVAVSAVIILVVLQLFQIEVPGLHFRILADDDEAPIIVRNGSLDIFAGNDWQWQAENDSNGQLEAYSYQPMGFHIDWIDNHLWVKISANAMTCDPATPTMPIHAATVKVTFVEESSSPTQPAAKYESNFQRIRRPINSRTNVKPGLGLTLSTADQRLRHGDEGKGYISQVMTAGLGSQVTCDFQKAADLTDIRICASAKRCQ